MPKSEIRLEDLSDSSRFPIHAGGTHVSMMEKCAFCMGNCSHTTGVTLNVKDVSSLENFQFTCTGMFPMMIGYKLPMLMQMSQLKKALSLSLSTYDAIISIHGCEASETQNT